MKAPKELKGWQIAVGQAPLLDWIETQYLDTHITANATYEDSEIPCAILYTVRLKLLSYRVVGNDRPETKTNYEKWLRIYNILLHLDPDSGFWQSIFQQFTGTGNDEPFNGMGYWKQSILQMSKPKITAIQNYTWKAFDFLTDEISNDDVGRKAEILFAPTPGHHLSVTDGSMRSIGKDRRRASRMK
jgi:hypothetical protein